MPTGWQTLPAHALIAAAVVLVAVTATFGIARLRQRYDTVDTFWGAGFALVAVLGFALSAAEGATSIRIVVTVLTVLWGLRLAIYLHLRNRNKPEDRRYAAMVQRAGRNPGRRIFLRVYLMQGAVLWFVSLPVLAAQVGVFGPLAWVGVAVWLVGFGFETVGDEQLRRFSADPANRGQVLDSGLWRYTRHPNYFGDACVWWGLYLLACSTWAGVATVLSPVVMTLLLARGSGKPTLEKDIEQRRPGYADYVRRTSGFIPLPPRAS